MFMCSVFSCVVGRGCLLWPVHSLGKTLLAFALLHSVFQGQICQICFLTSYFCIPVPYNEKDIFWGGWVLEGLVDLHRTIQLLLLQHYWSGYRLGLLWYWMVCLGNKQRTFFPFWDCIQVLHFSERLIALIALRDCSKVAVGEGRYIRFWWRGSQYHEALILLKVFCYSWGFDVIIKEYSASLDMRRCKD